MGTKIDFQVSILDYFLKLWQKQNDKNKVRIICVSVWMLCVCTEYNKL